MSDRRFMSSRYWQWYLKHRPFSLEEEQTFRTEALRSLVESVRAGEITSLDGVGTELSTRIRAHHGLSDFEMNSNWICSPQDWICPCCERSKFQISRAGKKGQILAKLVVHHDHMGEAMEEAFHSAFERAGTNAAQVDGLRLVEHIKGAFAAYEEVLICEDCNNADTEAKKQVAAPSYFSFSPGQIRQFISGRDHQPHVVDAGKAELIWREARPAYELRMKLIYQIAHAAATDAHWYEPHPRRTNAIPLLGQRSELGDSAIREWVSTTALIDELGPKTRVSAANLSRWRTVPQRLGKPLPGNYLAMLRSSEDRGNAWDSTPETWHCPVCERRKHETVYVGDKGKMSFYQKSNAGRGLWADAKRICNQCDSVLMSLKREAVDLAGIPRADSYSLVSPSELANIITARPHSPHLIDAEQADALMREVVDRLTFSEDEE